jgi:hypothetical protein
MNKYVRRLLKYPVYYLYKCVIFLSNVAYEIKPTFKRSPSANNVHRLEEAAVDKENKDLEYYAGGGGGDDEQGERKPRKKQRGHRSKKSSRSRSRSNDSRRDRRDVEHRL